MAGSGPYRGLNEQEVLQRCARRLLSGEYSLSVLADIASGIFGLKNIAGAQINPGTEETLQAILAALGGSPTVDTVQIYDEATSVAKSTPATVVQYTVPTGRTMYLRFASASGTNYAKFKLLVDGAPVRTLRSHDGTLNVLFVFDDDQNKGGIKLNAGQVVSIEVLHNRDWVGDFEGDIYGRLI